MGVGVGPGEAECWLGVSVAECVDVCWCVLHVCHHHRRLRVRVVRKEGVAW